MRSNHPSDSVPPSALGLADWSEIAPGPNSQRGFQILLSHADNPCVLIPMGDLEEQHFPVRQALLILAGRLKGALASGDPNDAKKWVGVVTRLEPVVTGYLDAIHSGPSIVPHPPFGTAIDSEIFTRSARKGSLEHAFQEILHLRDKVRLRALEHLEAASQENRPDEETRDGGVAWQAAAAEMERWRMAGERFTSQADCANRLGCSPATVNKAIKNTAELQEWTKRAVSSTQWATSIVGAVLDNTPQQREADPAGIVEQPDADVALAYLLDRAEPEERARIHAMSPAEQRQLAELAYRDPDREDCILGRED